MSARKVRCSMCGRMADWGDPPRGPCCSARRRLLDLGRGADKNRRVPSDADENENSADGAELPPDQVTR